MSSPTGRLPTSPNFQDQFHRESRQAVIKMDYTAIERRIMANMIVTDIDKLNTLADWFDTNYPSDRNHVAHDLRRIARQMGQPSHVLIEIGKTSRGHTIFRQDNGAGGHRYWSDAIGGGVMIWDTILASEDELRTCFELERVRLDAESTTTPQASS